jgi:hypothetical protein
MKNQPTLGNDHLLPFERDDGESDERNDSLLDDLTDEMFPDADDGDEDDESAPGDQAGQPSDDEGESDEDADEDEDDLDGEDDADEESEEGDEEEPDVLDLSSLAGKKVRVKVDGQDETVTLEEALAGYSRTAKFTREMQQLRERERTEVGAYREARDAYGNELGRVKQYLETLKPEEPDWDKLRVELDPGDFSARYIEYKRYNDQIAAVQGQLDAVQAEKAKDAERQAEEYARGQHKALLERVPEWRDPEKLQEDHARFREYARGVGFSDDELDQVLDHRVVMLLRDAAAGASRREKGTKLKAKVKEAAVLPPGGRTRNPKAKGQQRKAQDARKRLARSGHVDDAAYALEMSGLLDD